MRHYFAIVITAIGLVSLAHRTVAADAAPATQPASVAMIQDSNTAIRLSFARPEQWHTEDSKVINPKSGQTDIIFEMDGFDAGTQPTLKFSAEDNGAETKIDVSTPANPTATAIR